MPLFLCRWPNGDCSVVLARTRNDAIVDLDQVGNAEGCPITQVRTFQMHFVLTDHGELALERFGEGTKEEMFECAYPQLEHALDEAYRAEGYAEPWQAQLSDHDGRGSATRRADRFVSCRASALALDRRLVARLREVSPRADLSVLRARTRVRMEYRRR